MARVAIIGPGAIGGTLAGNLVRVGNHEVMLAGRRAVSALKVSLPDGTEVITGPVVAEPAQLTEKFDWVLVATKTYAAEATCGWLQSICGPETCVAIFQNGVEHRERFRPWVADEALVPVVIDCPAEHPAPDHVVQRGALKIVAADDANGQALRGLFAGANEHVSLTDDFLSAAWAKLTRNSVAVLNAMTLQPNVIMHDEAMGQAALQIAQESIAVARAAGATLDHGLALWVLDATLAAPRDAVNSLLADRLAGRETELEARNGAIVRFGQRLGVSTPLNSMGVAVVRAQMLVEQSNCD